MHFRYSFNDATDNPRKSDFRKSEVMAMDAVVENPVNPGANGIENFSIDAGSMVDDHSLVTDVQRDEIYASYSAPKKSHILYVGALLALITPFTDTVYLPALTSVGNSLNASDAAVAATVSAYLGAVGVGQLCFGPFSDKYGRLPGVYFSLLLYELTTIACIFSPNVAALIALRSAEGFFVSNCVVSVQAIIADVFAPAERGSAMGAFLAPMLVGPVIAPLIGGGLAQVYGWRSTFVLLAIMTIPIAFLAWIYVPETNHFYVLRRMALAKKEEPSKILPRLMMPWEPVAFLFDMKLAPYYSVIGLCFACMFTSLTLFPLYVAKAPYNLSPSMVGVAFLSIGIAMLLGSAFGGPFSDKSAAFYNHTLDGRMTRPLISPWILAASAIAFGYFLQYGVNLGAVLVAHFILGFCFAVMMPSTLGFLSSVYPEHAGATGSMMFALCFFLSCAFVSASVSISNAIGIGTFFLLFAIALCIASTWACYVNTWRVFWNKNNSSNN